MNFISELAYSVHIAQANKSARDKRQRNQYSQSMLLENESGLLENEAGHESAMLIAQLTSTIEQEERRTGSERRQTNSERGRYLESRLKKNRRYSADIYVKI